jgi:hypothetical protein
LKSSSKKGKPIGNNKPISGEMLLSTPLFLERKITLLFKTGNDFLWV